MLGSLMGCDLGNICVKTENVDYFTSNRRERDETNVTNDDVFRSVCSAYLRPIFVVYADMTHSPWENRIPLSQYAAERQKLNIFEFH
jgi:hypothetical protein